LRRFVIGPSVSIPVGTYDFRNVHGEYTFGEQRSISGTASVERGSFYGGTKTSIAYAVGGYNNATARLGLTRRFSIEPGMTVNRVELPQESFTTKLLTANNVLGVTPLMFLTALVQFNSDTHSISSNIRLRWEYRPGSELFVVYNDQHDSIATRFPSLQNRSFIIKVNRLLRF
jgi:hypothetical protein